MTGDDPSEAEATGATSPVNKLTWAQVGLVTEPDRYMFKFGWLTITSDDIAVWQNIQVPRSLSIARRRLHNPETKEKRQRSFVWAHSSYDPIPTTRKARSNRSSGNFSR
jgi:hypothetical protein